MKLPFASTIKKLQPVARLLNRYVVFTIFLVFAAIYVVLILRVNQLDGLSPTKQQIDDQLSTVPHPSINQPTLDKIQQLQNQNIQVQALFNQARNNPFSE